MGSQGEQWTWAADCQPSLEINDNVRSPEELICQDTAAQELLMTFLGDYAQDINHPSRGLPKVSSDFIPVSLKHRRTEPLPADYMQLMCASYTPSGKLIAVRTTRGGNPGSDLIGPDNYFVVVGDLRKPKAGFEHWPVIASAHPRRGLDSDSIETVLLLKPHTLKQRKFEDQRKRAFPDLPTLTLSRQGIVFSRHRSGGERESLGPVRNLVYALQEKQQAQAARLLPRQRALGELMLRPAVQEELALSKAA